MCQGILILVDQSLRRILRYYLFTSIVLIHHCINCLKKQVKPFNDTTKETFCKASDVIVKDDTEYTPADNAVLENAKTRVRRQTGYGSRGRFRGQTQSQYLAIDRGSGKDDGKAEAHSDADSSRASVS